MNTQTYRVIFSKARGCFMAVGENVRSNGGGCSDARRSRRRIDRRLNTPTGNQRLIISDVVANGDKYGTKTEALVNEVLKNDPSIKVLDGAKYGANNGLDHVVQYVDPQTGKTMTMVIDSKQLAMNGTTSLDPKAAGGVMQLSDESLRTVVGRLDGTPAGKAVEAALDSGTLVKAVAYVDKRTGELKVVPVAVPSKS